jgi:hypothetical protein
VTVSSSTAGSAGAGALVVTGGLSAGGASYIGGTLTANGNVFADGSYAVAGGTAGAFANAALTINNRNNGVNDLSVIAFGYRPNGSVFNGAAYVGYAAQSVSGNGFGDLIFGTRNVTTDTAPTERVRISSTGQFLVGKQTDSVANNGVHANPTGYMSFSLAGSTSAADTLNVYSTGAAAYRFYVDMAGTIHATSIVITAISDERLKENVRDIDTGLGAIMALKPRRFDWKQGKGQDKKDAAGFIAQEFETVFPECVSASKAGGDGIEYKTISHETLIPTLVKALQELNAELQSVRARLAALEAK